METQCNRQKLLFEAHERREVSAAFDGGKITSDGGGLLLREVEQRFTASEVDDGCSATGCNVYVWKTLRFGAKTFPLVYARPASFAASSNFISTTRRLP